MHLLRKHLTFLKYNYDLKIVPLSHEEILVSDCVVTSENWCLKIHFKFCFLVTCTYLRGIMRSRESICGRM